MKSRTSRPADAAAPRGDTAYRAWFTMTFDAQFARLFRFLDRLSGDPALAQDVAQEAFVRLYRRGSPPDHPEAWLVSVAMNLYRNQRTTATRRRRLLTAARGRFVHSDPPPSPLADVEAVEAGGRVRQALDALPERDRAILLLSAEGYSYRGIALALDLRETSVGVLLARAKRALRVTIGEAADASG